MLPWSSPRLAKVTQAELGWLGGGGDGGGRAGLPSPPSPAAARPSQGREGGGPASLKPWEDRLGGGWPGDGGQWRPQQRLQEVITWFPLGSPGPHFGQEGRAGVGYGKVGTGGSLLPLPPWGCSCHDGDRVLGLGTHHPPSAPSGQAPCCWSCCFPGPPPPAWRMPPFPTSGGARSLYPGPVPRAAPAPSQTRWTAAAWTCRCSRTTSPGRLSTSPCRWALGGG